MITPVYKRGLVLWVEVEWAHLYAPFLCLGDHGAYCPIKCEGL